jgi:hypothetical protein
MKFNKKVAKVVVVVASLVAAGATVAQEAAYSIVIESGGKQIVSERLSAGETKQVTLAVEKVAEKSCPAKGGVQCVIFGQQVQLILDATMKGCPGFRVALERTGLIQHSGGYWPVTHQVNNCNSFTTGDHQSFDFRPASEATNDVINDVMKGIGPLKVTLVREPAPGEN